MTMQQLRSELPSKVWRLTLDTGEVVAYVNGDNLPVLLLRASKVRKLQGRQARVLRFQRLTLGEVGNLRDNGMTFK